jgi:uncharacterized protein YecE (DUF72 family)
MSAAAQPVFVGTAGWSVPREVRPRFGASGSQLGRYAHGLGAAEINTSFYRPHQRATYERWAAEVPADFRFSVKVPQSITHESGLRASGALLDEFLGQAGGLGSKLACLLVQLPPSLAFDARTVSSFLDTLRRRWAGDVAMEPRHVSWFEPHPDALLARHGVARVLADPVRHAPGAMPGGWEQLIYLRLHGSPRMYYSAYEAAVVKALAMRIRQAQAEGRRIWCVFDNTASGAAAADALALAEAIARA